MTNSVTAAPQPNMLQWKAGGVPQRFVAEADGRLMYEVGLHQGEWYWLHNWYGLHKAPAESEQHAKELAQADFSSRQPSPQPNGPVARIVRAAADDKPGLVAEYLDGPRLPFGTLLYTHPAGTPPISSEGPAYLDFITPDEIFDKGPDAVKKWQEAKRAKLRPLGASPQNNLEDSK
ncbi:hypothetical protein J2857_003576 [Neorhizobium galegae]|uniref:hypothetical protein n=1 Tax=Neorhizobium galegae TaxID=399 RepID=UPI001AE94786|nr:hypothetical protein [Neorhizobium galegae]MBP2560807.1 hypothetical protein [Neorhizobium galegae]